MELIIQWEIKTKNKIIKFRELKINLSKSVYNQILLKVGMIVQFKIYN